MVTPTKGITPLYAEDINMLEGLDDTDLEAYLDYNPWIVPLFEIDVMGTAAGYAPTSMLQEEEYEHNPESIIELSRGREAFENEMEISRRVTASALEEVKIGTVA